ncbi:putative chloroperoxidase [Nemania serpens]|nr:putative chloroperoxidase [Nemania serpens]
MQFLTILALVTACAAGPIASRAALKPYVKPRSTDSRSPCPMLNTLANHGYLPHNGRNITAQDIGNAIFETTNWHSDFGVFPASAALTNLNVTHIDLADLNSSPGGEHPASLTRKDASSGDSNAIDTARTAQLFADSRTSFLTIDSVAKTRNRLDASSKPPLTAEELGVAQGEAALMMLLMRDTYVSLPTNEQDERFPTAQGWKPAEEVVQISDLGPIVDAVVASQAAQKGKP